MANYCKCHDKRLDETFAHSDVQARGISCVEVSLYGIQPEEAFLETADEVVSYVHSLPTGDPLFWAYPLCEQCIRRQRRKYTATWYSCRSRQIFKQSTGATRQPAVFAGYPRTTEIGNLRFKRRAIFCCEYPPSGSWVYTHHAVFLEKDDERVHTTLRTYRKWKVQCT